MSVFIKMTHSTGQGVKVIEVAIRNAGNWDTFWGKKDDPQGVANDWAESRIDMFLSQGASTGTRWPDYNKMERKYYVPVKRYVLGNQKQPKVAKMPKGSVLRYTNAPQSRTPSTSPVKEKLFPAMTVQSDPYFVYDHKPGTTLVEVGTSLPYAWNHDQGIGGWTRTWGKKKKKSVTVLTPARALTRFGNKFISDLRNRLGQAASNMGGKVGITDAEYAAKFKINGGKIGL